jgi:glycosyltransferase involved in cell wall biosynthesis
MARPRLLFISPRYLFPTDSGGKIRTVNVLRGLKGGRFEIILASPKPADTDSEALAQVCDRFVGWPDAGRGWRHTLTRALSLFDRVPIPVASDRSTAGRKAVANELERAPDLIVVDFPHAAVLLPDRARAPAVLFTHNVEAEIFKRHAIVAGDPLRRALWRSQTRKMERFEREVLNRFDTAIAVSERDAEYFNRHYAPRRVSVIPTGVDLDYFQYAPRQASPGDSTQTVVFTGSMDWLANIDGIEHFMDAIWPAIQSARPSTRMIVVGRNPPARLVETARSRALPWEFTGFVDDVRPFVHRSDVFVIPLRVGGGTRIKAYEAMAMGCAVVSTSIGIEGLPVAAGRDYENADTPEVFARAVVQLLDDTSRRKQMALNARRHVEAHFSAKRAAEVFEAICIETLHRSATANLSRAQDHARDAIEPISSDLTP